MAFRLPRDGQTYITDITQRCEDLINSNIWQGLHISALRRWLSNFVAEEEKYFAACILDSLIYRSEAQTLALIKQLLQRVLPDLSRQVEPPIGKSADWVNLLRSSSGVDPNIRLIPVRKRSDPPTKSSHIVLRLMKRYLNVEEQWMANPSDVPGCINNGIQTYLFVDDFLGTGVQFEEFLKCEDLERYVGAAYMAYVPLAGHTDGVSYLEQMYPSLCVRPVERLDSGNSLFSAESQCFRDGVNTPDCAKEFYYDLLKRKGINISGPSRRGFGHLELAYFFSHAAPDNCLPLLWWGSTSSWRPLFNR